MCILFFFFIAASTVVSQLLFDYTKCAIVKDLVHKDDNVTDTNTYVESMCCTVYNYYLCIKQNIILIRMHIGCSMHVYRLIIIIHHRRCDNNY